MLRLIGSSFSIPATYPPHERGLLVQFQGGKMNHKHNVQKKGHAIQRFQYCSRRFSTLVNSEGNIEKQSFKKDWLEHDYSSKHEDAYNGLLGKLYAFFQFTRPYATLGMALQLASVSCLPVETMAEFSPTFFIEVIKAIILTMLAHIYNIGINQLFDIEIDKANKKQLPIATGALSIGTTKAIVWIATLLSLSMGVMSQSPALLCGILANLMSATIYSVDLPFFRWKRDPILTAIICMFRGGIGGTIPYFIHSQKYILGKPITITKSLIFASVVMVLYGIAIGTLKDIPDVDGDKENGIVTLSTKFGRERILGHSAFGVVLLFRSRTVDLTDKSSAQSFYMFTWKLHYAECILLQFVR